MKRFTRVLTFGLGIAMLASSTGFAHCHHDTKDGSGDPVSKPVSGESVYQLRSSWKDQSERTLKLAQLRGKHVVMAMIYTSCKAVCPLIVRDMQKIEQALPAGIRDQTEFVAVSFDPERDTPSRLKEYASQQGATGVNWLFLNGKSSDVRDLAAVLGVRYKKTADGDYSHSNVITILDPEGVIRHQQVGLGQDPAESVKAMSGP